MASSLKVVPFEHSQGRIEVVKGSSCSAWHCYHVSFLEGIGLVQLFPSLRNLHCNTVRMHNLLLSQLYLARHPPPRPRRLQWGPAKL